ncbi:MAG: helix-turn-helix transcriptional regulator [Clostridia bacterium]|nr:helix-turn-helix transcriptional regulator [Clostridia bacterium]
MYIETNKNIETLLPIIPTYIGYTNSQGKTVRPKGAERNLVIWVTEGEGSFVCGEKRRLLTKGQGFFVKKGIPHSYEKQSETFSTMWVSFLRGEELLDYYKIGDSFFFDAPPFLVQSTMELMDFCEHTSGAPLKSSRTMVWFCELLDFVFKKEKSKVQKARDYLEQNYSRQISLDDVAKYVNMNKYVLCHKYKHTTKESITETLKKIRIQKAKALLSHSEYNIDKISSMCGYENPCYFIKIFREQVGVSPGKYKNRM